MHLGVGESFILQLEQARRSISVTTTLGFCVSLAVPAQLFVRLEHFKSDLRVVSF